MGPRQQGDTTERRGDLRRHQAEPQQEERLSSIKPPPRSLSWASVTLITWAPSSRHRRPPHTHIPPQAALFLQHLLLLFLAPPCGVFPAVSAEFQVLVQPAPPRSLCCDVRLMSLCGGVYFCAPGEGAALSTCRCEAGAASPFIPLEVKPAAERGSSFSGRPWTEKIIFCKVNYRFPFTWRRYRFSNGGKRTKTRPLLTRAAAAIDSRKEEEFTFCLLK